MIVIEMEMCGNLVKEQTGLLGLDVKYKLWQLEVKSEQRRHQRIWDSVIMTARAAHS